MGNLLKEIFYALGESIVGLIVGLYFLFVLDNIMGELIIIIGFLITLSRYIICRSFVVEFETLLNFYRLKDEIQQKHDIEFLNKADEIQKKFFNEMQKLSQGEIKYDSIGPYLEAAKRHVKNTKKCMKATSLVDPREWLEGGQLFDYFQEQVKALKKKKKLEIFRIFFLTERQKSKKTTKKVLKMHKDAGIKVFIARDNLPKSISAEIKPFVIYDDKVAIVGNVSKERQIPAGIKTIDDLNISKLNNLFDQVKTLHSDKF